MLDNVCLSDGTRYPSRSKSCLVMPMFLMPPLTIRHDAESKRNTSSCNCYFQLFAVILISSNVICVNANLHLLHNMYFLSLYRVETIPLLQLGPLTLVKYHMILHKTPQCSVLEMKFKLKIHAPWLDHAGKLWGMYCQHLALCKKAIFNF